jgi:uncharacterized protein YycO
MNYLENQIGDEYGFTSFNNRSKWYCSKLPWVGWEEFYSTSLNRNGGLCTPDDIVRYTLQFAHDD